MASSSVQSATSLPVSPVDDRRNRVRRYTITMSVRSVCLVLAVLAPDWWKVVFGVGAVVLPYIAVVVANAGSSGGTDPVHSPGPVQALAIEPRRPE